MEFSKIISQNFLCSGAPTQVATVGIEALDISAGTLYIQNRIPSGTSWVVQGKYYFQPSASGIASVTGLNTDNTDPLNPIVRISVDDSTITGDGTPGSPLVGAGGVPTSRTISTTAPLTGGGDLSANRTIAIAVATSIANGYLSAADWNIFNAKQTALGFTPENVANKATDLTSPDNTKYPTTLAVSTAIASSLSPLGYYGAFQDNTSQTAASINTAYAMKLGITDLNNGVTVVSDGSNLTRVTIANTGIYNIQFSAQFDRTNSGTDSVDIWLRKNGVDVPGSGGKIVLAGGAVASAIIATWNYVLDVAAGDYYQLMWSTPDTHVRLLYEAAQTSPFAHPIIPSVILTVTQQSGIMAGTGITAINSLTGAAQTMAAGTSGTDFAISSSGTIHSFNLPTASASNRGALSSADWTTFNGKQNALGYTPENVANKATDLTSPDNTKYPTTLAVSNALASAGVTINKTMALIAAY
jgi:hypothetical protein